MIPIDDYVDVYIYVTKMRVIEQIFVILQDGTFSWHLDYWSAMWINIWHKFQGDIQFRMIDVFRLVIMRNSRSQWAGFSDIKLPPCGVVNQKQRKWHQMKHSGIPRDIYFFESGQTWTLSQSVRYARYFAYVNDDNRHWQLLVHPPYPST